MQIDFFRTRMKHRLHALEVVEDVGQEWVVNFMNEF